MATLSHSDTRRLYSWWWDSHIPKNSKWLQENLTDMDGKVKAMIKLIEEDADSFARRAEMYYKKRPELMKMVEEFYRAYRALAERHDHLTGELRHAQRTIATAFPGHQLPFEMEEDSPARSSATESERRVSDVLPGLSLAFLGQVNRGSCSAEYDAPNHEAEALKAMALSESQHAVKAENEVQDLKRAIADVQAEKDTIFLQYQICLEKLSNMETDLHRAENESMKLDEQKVRAESEIETMKHVLARLEVEKADALTKQKESIAQIADLQGIISHAENESQSLTESISKIESEKEDSIQTYKLCLEKISYLENKLSLAEEDVKLFKEKAEKAENEVSRLRKLLAELTVEKEYADLQFKICVKRVSDLESELARVQEDVKRLNTEVQTEAMKRKNSEEKCSLLEISKQSLTQEADDLARKIAMKDEALLKKHTELENEILYLKMMKARLEEEVIKQTEQTDSLQKEVSSLSEEINGLNEHYRVLLKKLESVGVNPDTVETSVKNLVDENSKLKRIYESESIEKEVISKRLTDMEEASKKRNVLERSLSQLNGQLEASRGEVNEMQKTNQFLLGEKSVLVAEKATLLAQLQALTENMQKALGNNAVLENSLSSAKIELEGLREKSKGLEEICHLLKSEKSDLFTQRETLIVQLANVERRMELMDHKYAGLEERYTDLEMLNKRLESEIQALTLSLNTEKLERTNSAHRYETLLVSAEQHIHLLQAENRRRKKEYEDELDKAARAELELFILQKFIQDMEAKNGSLLIECQKHVEASKLTDKLISELEREHLEEEVEAELLIDEIEKSRLGICRIFKVLEAGSSGHGFQENVPKEQVLVNHIIGSIEEMKRSIAKYKDDKRLLQVENTVLSTLLGQMASEGTEINSKKELLEEDKKVITEKLMNVENEKEKLLETNGLLKSQLSLLQTDMGSLSDVEKAYLDLLENHFQLLDDNRRLSQECSDLNAEKCLLEEENDDSLYETLTFSVLSTVFESFANENSMELSTMDEVLYDLTETKDEIEKERELLQGKLELKEEENMFLEDVVQSFELEMLGVKDVLRQKETELSESAWKLRAEEEINLELANTLDILKTRFVESSLAREATEHRLVEEVEGLQEDNANLVSELSKLREECEEHKGKEENLSAELEAKDAEVELWEAEAAVFYFDLQALSVREVLHENKVHELTEMCGDLRDETVSRAREIQEMKGKLMRMESEIEELKAELSAYAPIIASLMDDVTSLEHSALLHTKLLMLPDDFETKSAGFNSSGSFDDITTDDELTVQTGIQDLRKLQLRINAVEKTMIEEIKKLVVQQNPKVGDRKGTVMKKITNLKPHGGFIHRKAKEKNELGPNLDHDVVLFDVKTEALASRKGSSMKDIQLDQISESSSNRFGRRGASSATERVDDKVLEMWETAQYYGLSETAGFRKIEHPSDVCEVEKELGVDKLEVLSSNLVGQSKQEAKTMKILEKLASDARRLTSLQFTVENLSKKLDSNKKIRKHKDVDLDTVKEQLLEVEETVYQLVELNGKLMGNVVESPRSSGDSSQEMTVVVKRKEVTDEARKGSEKIGRLQVELQKIEYVLLKLEDEKKAKEKNRFPRNRTSIILRDFVYYNGRKNSGKKRKSRLCGCFRSSSIRDQNRT